MSAVRNQGQTTFSHLQERPFPFVGKRGLSPISPPKRLASYTPTAEPG